MGIRQRIPGLPTREKHDCASCTSASITSNEPINWLRTPFGKHNLNLSSDGTQYLRDSVPMRLDDSF